MIPGSTTISKATIIALKNMAIYEWEDMQVRNKKSSTPSNSRGDSIVIVTIQVKIEKKGKNTSREEIFYQMKGFVLFRSVLRSGFRVSSIRESHRNSKGLHN